MSLIKLSKNLGLLFAGVWLLAFGVLFAFPAVQFANWNVVLGLLAFVTGVLVVVSHAFQPETAIESKT
jgi:uncharacterized membrane protein HdeD (DUF308 family)